MKILVVGGTGIIGKALVELLRKEHEVIAIGKSNGDYQVDIEDKASIEKMFEDFKDIDGVISATGEASLGALKELKDEDFDFSIKNKLMGQINLIREGLKNVKDNGFILLTTGAAAHTPFPGSSAISMTCAGVEAFVKSADIEKERNIRINVVRPAMVTESMKIWNMQVPNSVSAADTARVYKAVMELDESAAVYDVHERLEMINN